MNVLRVGWIRNLGRRIGTVRQLRNYQIDRWRICDSFSLPSTSTPIPFSLQRSSHNLWPRPYPARGISNWDLHRKWTLEESYEYARVLESGLRVGFCCEEMKGCGIIFGRGNGWWESMPYAGLCKAVMVGPEGARTAFLFMSIHNIPCIRTQSVPLNMLTHGRWIWEIFNR